MDHSNTGPAERPQHHLDDESGQIELRFDVSLLVYGSGSYAFTPSVAFQVMTLATV